MLDDVAELCLADDCGHVQTEPNCAAEYFEVNQS